MIDKILGAFRNIGNFIGDLFKGLFDLLLKPLSLLLDLLIGVFYFITKIFNVLIEVIKLFVAMFQFLFAIVSGLVRTISSWIGFTPSSSYSMPSASRQGFEAVISQIAGTGLINIIPLIAIALVWIFFAIKIVGLFGDKGAS